MLTCSPAAHGVQGVQALALSCALKVPVSQLLQLRSLTASPWLSTKKPALQTVFGTQAVPGF